MYALAIVRYRKPLEEVLKVVEPHRAYLRELQAKGLLLASGPLDPRNGGALLLRVPDEGAAQALDAIRDGDPFIQQGCAQYELLPWLPNIGVEGLDKL
ncbi:MAG TPA: YciI family protein [Holophagaceae bacterium]|nr:YciI family protein [Holophagaceae bacterium]